jgi:acyl-CoA thioester hydrolase
MSGPRFVAASPAQAVSGWRDGWFVVPHEVTFRDIDFFGHVNNAVYFTFFEWARTKYWLTMLGGQLPRDIGFIVARAECDFRLQIEFAEPIEIAVRVGEMRTTSLDFVYEIRKSTGGIAAIGKVVVVLFDWTTQAKRPIDEDLREQVREFQQA